MIHSPLGTFFNANSQAQTASGFLDVVSFFVEADHRCTTP